MELIYRMPSPAMQVAEEKRKRNLWKKKKNVRRIAISGDDNTLCVLQNARGM